MGQKINSNFTRTNIKFNYLSKWYANKLKYSSILFEDAVVRQFIINCFGHILSLSNLIIKRIFFNNKNNFEQNQVIINAKSPSILKIGNFFKKVPIFNNNNFNKKLKSKLIKHFFILYIKKYSFYIAKYLSITYNKNYKISFSFIKNKFLDIKLISNYIAKEYKKKKNPILILKNVIKALKKFKVKGAFLQISGRIKGAERAKKIIARFGSVPAQTFSKNIFFEKNKLKTTSGIIGIKVQIYL